MEQERKGGDEMLFRKKIERCCAYCQYAGKIDEQSMVMQALASESRTPVSALYSLLRWSWTIPSCRETSSQRRFSGNGEVMTCLLALENGNLSDVVTVSESALSNLDPSSSTANLKAGEQMTLENILYCM